MGARLDLWRGSQSWRGLCFGALVLLGWCCWQSHGVASPDQVKPLITMEQQRINMTLRWSFTNGSSWWKEPLQIWSGASGYSSMTALDGPAPEDAHSLFIIYEKGWVTSTDSVSVAKISINGKL